MRIVALCGPPCSGKTTLAHHLATPNVDVILDYDDIARDLGSPTPWNHPEPWRTQAEHAMRQRITQAHRTPRHGTAWLIRTTPRPAQRMRLTTQWAANVYLLNPGETECVRRARADQRPSGTARAIGIWYHRYRPWAGDRDPGELDPRWATPGARGMLSVDPRAV